MVTAQALSRRLSANSLSTPPVKPAAPDKPLSSSGGSGTLPAAAPGRATKSPRGPLWGEAPPLSAHDTKNTINVSQVGPGGLRWWATAC